MKIYIAAPYAARDDLKAGLVPFLMNDGHEITSSWLWGSHAITQGTVNAAPAHTDEHIMEQTAQDLTDIDTCDVLVLLTSHWITSHYELKKDQTTSGGRHFESGYAWARNKRIITLGEPENIFQRCTKVVASLEELTLALQPTLF